MNMEETKALKIVEQPMNEAMQKSTPYAAMLAGKEEAYETCLALAIKATKPQDWVDYGGNPFLQEPGARRIAMRFGISLFFDRNDKGEIVFQREDFTDELGPIVKYRVSGKAQIGDHVVEGIGSASSRDDFLGWEWKDKNDKNQGKRPKPLYAVLEDVEKKAATNLFSNLIKAILAIKGFTWEDLAKYGITREGKKGFEFRKPSGPAKPPVELPPPDGEELRNRGTHWEWIGKDGGKMISAKLGDTFSDNFLRGVGLRQGANKTIWTAKHSDALWTALEGQANQREPGQDESL